MRVDGMPFDQGQHPQGKLAPTAGVLHRTYGAFGVDGFKSAYSVGKNGRRRPDGSMEGIGFPFLVGKHEGQWVQFYDSAVKTAHAKGANDWAVGIEFDGVNEEPLTDWQVDCGARIVLAMHEGHDIPITYYTGERKKVAGWLPHASVPGSTHTDTVSQADWDRIVRRLDELSGDVPRPPLVQRREDDMDMMLTVDKGGHYHFRGNLPPAFISGALKDKWLAQYRVAGEPILVETVSRDDAKAYGITGL